MYFSTPVPDKGHSHGITPWEYPPKRTARVDRLAGEELSRQAKVAFFHFGQDRGQVARQLDSSVWKGKLLLPEQRAVLQQLKTEVNRRAAEGSGPLWLDIFVNFTRLKFNKSLTFRRLRIMLGAHVSICARRDLLLKGTFPWIFSSLSSGLSSSGPPAASVWQRPND
jgi:hypothetical protein